MLLGRTYWPHAAMTAIAAIAATVAIRATALRENPYPDLTEPDRHMQQALDYLTVDPNIPFDGESATIHFVAILSDPDAPNDVKDTASFLRAWCRWTRPVPDFDGARNLFAEHLDAYPDSAYDAETRYVLALIEIYDPVNGDANRAIAWLKDLIAGDPDTTLAAFATRLVADLYRERLGDATAGADWYGRAYLATEHVYRPDERLVLLYVQGKLLQSLDRRDEAVAAYRHILDSTEGRTGIWTDRVLDRLEELGADVEGDYFSGLDETPMPMTDHQFQAGKPTSITVSFWILEKSGMKRGIEEIVKNYEARTPGVKVNVVGLPYQGYHDWLQSQILGNEIPDIVQIDLDTAIRYGAYQGKLVETTPYLNAPNPYTGIPWGEMYYPQFILSARDQVYRKNWIISWASENTAFFYNKDAFRQAGIVRTEADGRPLLDEAGREVVDEPATWDELMAAFEKLRAIGVYGSVCEFYPDPAPLIWQQPYLRKQVYDNLIPLYDNFIPDDEPDPYEIAYGLIHGTLDLTDPEVAEPWRLLYQQSEYWVPGSTSLDIQQAFDFFARGKSATIFWVSTDMSTFEDIVPFEIGVFPFPLLESSPYYDGEYSEEFTLSAFEFAVPKVTQRRGTTAAAMDFLMYFTSPEAQTILSREAVCLSPIRGVAAPEKLEPFLSRMNRRGTHLTIFDPYLLRIVKEPYWVDARDTVWNELNELLGNIPNYDFYQRTTGGTPEEYRVWREERFQEFLQALQDYFLFAYKRLAVEYPDDLRREVRRAQNLWIADFRALRVPVPGTGAENLDALTENLDDYWRTISDNLGLIARCESLVDPEIGLAYYQENPLPYRAFKQVVRVCTVAIILLCTAIVLVLTWSGVLGRMLRDWRLLAVFVPTLVLMGLFAYTPAASAIYHAFFIWNGSDISEFTGLGNFRAMLTDNVLHHAIVVMLLFLGANLVKFLPTIAAAVILFHLANRRLQYAFRVVFVLPMAVPTIVGLLVWKYFYRMEGGLLNTLLLHQGLIKAPVNWLGSTDTVVPSLLFIGFPWVSTIGVLILLAGLQSIPQSVFDATLIDGCGPWRRFFRVELPLVAGQIKLNLILITIGTIQDFWLPLVLTKGGPNNASMLPGLWMYQNAFSHGRMGYAAALGLVMFLVILALAMFNIRFVRSSYE
jgi:raffinose/stachyose/melibiose transport system permease protein